MDSNNARTARSRSEEIVEDGVPTRFVDPHFGEHPFEEYTGNGPDHEAIYRAELAAEIEARRNARSRSEEIVEDGVPTRFVDPHFGEHPFEEYTGSGPDHEAIYRAELALETTNAEEKTSTTMDAGEEEEDEIK